MNNFRVSFRISSMFFLIAMIMLTVSLPTLMVWYVGEGANPYIANVEKTPLLIQKIEDAPESIKSAEFIEVLKSSTNAQVQRYELYKQHTRLQRVLGTITICWLLAHVLISFLAYRRNNET
jgi:biopolymer transport protein ExbB/TolQ